MVCDTHFLPSNDGHSQAKDQEHALIVWELMVSASDAACITWRQPSLFFVRALRHPETAKPGKMSAAAETFQRSASKEYPWQTQANDAHMSCRPCPHDRKIPGRRAKCVAVMAAVSVETRDLPECCTARLVQTCCTTSHGLPEQPFCACDQENQGPTPSARGNIGY